MQNELTSTEQGIPAPRGRWWRATGPILLYVALTVVHTWPLASDPAGLSRNDNADAQLNAWIVSWIAHQLPRDPARLFEANIFYPEPRALALSEPLLVPGVAAIPLRALGASAVLTFNLLVLAGFVLTALAGHALGRRLTGDPLAALLAGSLIAFGPHTLTRIPHLQAQWIPMLPLALLALDALLERRTMRPALALGACLALLAATSGYGLVLGVVAVGVGALARADEWRRGWRQLAPRLAAGALLSLALALPVLLPYWHVVQDLGLHRSADEASAFASRASSFLSTPARMHHGLWSHRFDQPQGGSYFPGVTAIALSITALLVGRGLRSGRLRMSLSLALAGAILALGPSTPFYAVLQSVLPPMRGLRDPSRFGALLILGVSLAAAAGTAALRSSLPSRWRTLVPLILLLFAQVEVLCAPLGFVPYSGLSPVYERLAREPGRVAAVELPVHTGDRVYLNAAYVLASTVHWTPLVNGYSGIIPPGFAPRAEALGHLPDPASVDEMRRLGLSHLIVHLGRYRPERQARIVSFLDRRPDVTCLATGPDGERLYRLDRTSAE